MEIVDAFDSEADCRKHLERLRWPNGVICPRCKGDKIARLEKYDRFYCNGCDYQFTVTAGTIFHDSHLPLRKWFLAVHLIAQGRKGVSANQLKRTISVSYKTAWYLCHRIRAAMENESAELLKGIIEKRMK